MGKCGIDMSIVLIKPINMLTNFRLESGGQFPVRFAWVMVVVDICRETKESGISMIRHGCVDD
jgi:hypothetical protein